MKIWERRLISGGLAIAGFLFLIAAFRPTLSGLPLNVTFFLIGIVVLVGGVVAWRKLPQSAQAAEGFGQHDATDKSGKS
jgi:hypothetical protein